MLKEKCPISEHCHNFMSSRSSPIKLINCSKKKLSHTHSFHFSQLKYCALQVIFKMTKTFANSVVVITQCRTTELDGKTTTSQENLDVGKKYKHSSPLSGIFFPWHSSSRG